MRRGNGGPARPMVIIAHSSCNATHRLDAQTGAAVESSFLRVSLKSQKRALSDISVRLSVLRGWTATCGEALTPRCDGGRLGSTSRRRGFPDVRVVWARCGGGMGDVGSGRKIVVHIEGDPALMELVRAVLERGGCDVIGAASGGEGLDAARRVGPDLVLLELSLLGVDGWEVYRQLRADRRTKDVPVVAVIDQVQEIDRALGPHLAGLDGYVTKPLGPQELARTVSLGPATSGLVAAPLRARTEWGPIVARVGRPKGGEVASGQCGRWTVELLIVRLEKPEAVNVILGQSHFIKTVEDVHEALVTSVPGIKFGLAFCESSGPALVRASGTDDGMIELAKRNALELSAGHSFCVFLAEGFYPVNVLNVIKMVPEVCRIFCATANPVEVILAQTDQGRGILGVIDGVETRSIETDADVAQRKDFLRMIGYKL